MTGWKALDKNCDPAERPSSEQGCFYVCDYHQHQYIWNVSAWSQCEPRDESSSCVNHQYGVQSRNVLCLSKCSGIQSGEHICNKFQDKPVIQRPCKLPCPEDCVATQTYGEWSSCERCWTHNRTRVRQLLRLPQHGGQNCTALTQTQACGYREQCNKGKTQTNQMISFLMIINTHTHI